MLIGPEYIKYRWKAKRRHGVHSPFVYKLADECFNQTVDPGDKEIIRSLYNKLKRDTREIEIVDLGAGSKKLSNKRSISSIAKTSSSKGKYGALLYNVAKHVQSDRILEFGTSLGIGTTHFKLGNPKSKITTVEGCPNTWAIANENFKQLQFDEIQSVNSSFDDFIKSNINVLYDVIFIDGHHDGNALIHYVNQLMEHSHDNTLFILDDIRWSDSMYKAWCDLKNDARFNVSIDLFRMGIIAKRSQQQKESFSQLL